jgi:asparagine synthase (glutamine-hydrolysing)
LVFGERTKRQREHWTLDRPERISYPTDRQYEEHFLQLFGQAVARRTGPGAPTVAHLSGGVDSTSIVCMCDALRRARSDDATRLIDTLSFYDDSEPNWDEKPYFSLIELRRGQTGFHIASSFADWTFAPAVEQDAPYLFPGADSGTFQRESRIFDRLGPRCYRAIVAGTGGDELLGGVPTPLPMLADDLLSLHLSRLLRHSMEWCLMSRKPLATLLRETVGFTLDLYQESHDAENLPAWIRLRSAKDRKDRRPGPWRSRPSSLSRSRVWTKTIATLPHLFPAALYRYEYRYPYLDRDLVEFLSRLPPEQLVRPGHRRSLMRRALHGVVPHEILDRRRKAFLSRGPHGLLRDAEDRIRVLFTDCLMEQCGFIDSAKFLAALALLNRGEDAVSRTALMRTIGFELWLRASSDRIAPGSA